MCPIPSLRPSAALFSLLFVLLGSAGASPASANWSADTTIGTRVCAATRDQIEPIMVSDQAGGFIMLWTDFRKPVNDPDLYCRRVDANGDTLWASGGTVVCDAPGVQTRPTMISDGHGGAFMAWVDLRTNGSPGYYVQHIAANGERRWAANGIRPVSGINAQFGPKICRDAADGIFLAFASGNPGTQIQRLDSAGVTQLAAPPLADGPLLRDNPSAPLAIEPDGSGGAIVAIGYGGATPVDIAAQRVTGAGTQLWAAGGVIVCDATGTQGAASLVSDGAQGAILAWDDARVSDANTDIYARRVSAAGSAMGVDDGIPLCDQTSIQTGVQLRGLTGGGAVAVWRDYRHLPATSLYAQRVDGSATPAWIDDGRRVCSAELTIQRYSVVPGLGDTAYVAWNTFGSDFGDVYAQKLDGSGGTHWGAYGATVCRGPFDQQESAAVGDGAGGLFVGYRDRRSPGNPDLYAQHLGPNGIPGPPVVDVPPGPPAPAGRLRGLPNPAPGVQVISFGRPIE